KKDDRLDWMYQGPAGQVSRDEYLLGRPIDKQITDQYADPESGPSMETGLLPGSIFNPNTATSGLDMAAKIREDPLFEIRKREEAKKREVLTNPVKMKKIKEMLRQNLDKDKKKKRKKEKKEKKDKDRKKEKKHKKRTSSSSSDEEDDRKHKSHSHYEASSDKKLNGHHLPGYGLQLPAGKSHHISTSYENHSSRRERSRSRSPHRNHRDHHSSSNRSDRRDNPRAPTPPKERYQRHNHHVSKKLSADELERKRRVMMDQAKQREEDRENNVKRYKKQDEREKQREQNTKREEHAGFI
ncbi:hypothetical protein NL108_008193, partial [Boleophthalmus pectinirostris]